jgi:hypothetical protein
VVEESGPAMKSSGMIGWELRENEEKKDDKIVQKKNAERMDESDSDSDDEEDEQMERKKRKHKRGKKGGFLKMTNFFD